MRVLITASREWTDEFTVHMVLDSLYSKWRESAHEEATFTVVHGDCRGGDKIARRWAEARHKLDHRVDHEAHPAEWEKHGLAAGHKRNKVMVDKGADRCEGFPLGRSPGTRGCMRLAKKAGIPTKTHFPRASWEQVQNGR